MFKNTIALSVLETGYHFLEKNRIIALGCKIYADKHAEIRRWTASNVEDETVLLHEFKDFLDSLELQRTLIITYDGKEYDFKILTTRAMILEIDLASLLNFQHIDLYDFLKKNTRLGMTNVFDVAHLLKCESVRDAAQKEHLRMISPAALAIEKNWKELIEYNNEMLSTIYEIYEKIKPYLFPEFKMDVLDYKSSQESIFG